MRPRWLVLVWLVLGLIVWIGVFGLHVEIGVQQYLRLLAEFEAGLGPEPSLTGVMDGARARGTIQALTWAVLIVAAGMGTLRYGGASGGSDGRAPSGARRGGTTVQHRREH